MELAAMRCRLDELIAQRDALDRVQKAVAKRQVDVDRQVEAYQTLIELYADPAPDVPGLDELESFLGVPLDGDEADVHQRNELQPLSVECDGEADEELAPFRDCKSPMEVADRLAALNEGVVYVAKATDVSYALGLANLNAKRPRKQLWVRVYSGLRDSERYEHGGKGTGKFTLITDDVVSETLVGENR